MSSTSSDAVVVDRAAGSVAIVRLNRARTRNALTAEVKAGLSAAISALMADPGVGCIVLTGSEGAFCSGGNIADMADRDAPAVRARMQASHAWASLLLQGETPVVAAVNGPAAGAGFSLAMLCDVVMVSDTAYFQAGFPAIGAVPDLALALTLPRAIGTARARELLLTNRRVGAAEAVAIGIAARACGAAELAADALHTAAAIAAGPRMSLGMTKTLLAHAYDPVNTFLQAEAMSQAMAFGTADFAEGVAAFVAKRKPIFGR